jgi:hypothetical protein
MRKPLACTQSNIGTMKPSRLILLAFMCVVAAVDCNRVTGSNPTQLTANVVDPQSVNAVSLFNSCVGHPYPDPASPNSGKNYFWANSTNFGTNDQLKVFAACSGTITQTNNDTNDPAEFTRGWSVHLFCDNSSTSLRYFHLNIDSTHLGHHVNAGDFLGFGAMAQAGQPPSGSWQNSPNIDVAVNNGDDSRTQNYFSSLDGATFAAWSVRGVTSVSQTIKAGAPICANFSGYIGTADVFSFMPVR